MKKINLLCLETIDSIPLYLKIGDQENRRSIWRISTLKKVSLKDCHHHHNLNPTTSLTFHHLIS